jgi:DNA helicase-2/ATP-dependent DNA helicase PcrA
MDPDALVADLDQDQRRAVTTESQLVAVVAGAGSGKTRVLTRRVAYRIATGSADEGHTVVLTFTREAAGELRRRLPSLGVGRRITTGTFHSVAHGMLQQRWRDREQRQPTLVADKQRILSRLVDRDGRGVDMTALVAEIDWATSRRASPDAYVSAARRGERKPPIAPERVAQLLDAYRNEKRTRGVIDLDDLLVLTIEALEREPEFADAVRFRFQHVLVDEAQDLNPLQHQLVDLIRRGRDDLFLVGDPAQAIYGFNGADPSLLVDVASRFPGIEIVRLPVNHRCTPQVVDAGVHALRADGQGAALRSARDDGPVVRVLAHADEQAEAAAIAKRVAQLDRALLRTSNVAVLARTNAQLPVIGRALSSAGIEVRRPVHGSGSQLHPALNHVLRIGDSQTMRRWAQDALEGSDPALDVDSGAVSAEQEVGRAVLDFLRSQPTGDGANFRAWVDANDPFGRTVDGVELLTFHGAKGREWHTVLLAGCESSLVPHRTATTGAARSEEARLLYVAITRATDELVVNWANRRGGYQRKLSPLLEGFASTTPEPVAAPPDLPLPTRSERELLLERLHAWRAAAARTAATVPEAVCTDAALALIADHRPTTPTELDELTGLGAITSSRLFPGIDAAVHAHV